jgi:hypothetical protein
LTLAPGQRLEHRAGLTLLAPGLYQLGLLRLCCAPAAVAGSDAPRGVRADSGGGGGALTQAGAQAGGAAGSAQLQFRGQGPAEEASALVCVDPCFVLVRQGP